MPRSRRRWLQFSMRTMLVVVSVTCVLLALWGVPAERRRRAVAAIEAIGGRVNYVACETTSESFPITVLRPWLPRAYFDKIDSVILIGAQITDPVLVHLQVLTDLHAIALVNTRLTDAGLVQLRKALPNCTIIGP